MKKVALHFSRTLLWLAVFLLVFVIIFEVSGRVLTHYLNNYRHQFEVQLHQLFRAEVSIGNLQSHWSGLNPGIQINGFRLYPPKPPTKLAKTDSIKRQPSVKAKKLIIELDAFHSLLSWKPVFKAVVIRNLAVHVDEVSSGNFALAGFDRPKSSTATKTNKTTSSIYPILGSLALQKYVQLDNIKLKLHSLDKKTYNAKIETLSYQNKAQQQRLLMRLKQNNQPVIELIANHQGSSERWNKGSFQGYFNIPEQDFSPWLDLLAIESVQLKQADFGAKLWFNLKKHQSWQAQGQIKVNHLELLQPKIPLPNLHDLSATLSAQGGANQPWQLWLENFSFAAGDKKWPASSWYLTQKQGNYLVSVDQLNLKDLKQFSQTPSVPKKVLQLIDTLDPKGELKHLTLSINPKNPIDFELMTEVKDLAVNAWNSAPSGSGIHGFLRTSATRGQLILDSDQLSLGLPTLFRDSWHWQKTQGTLDWFVDKDHFILDSDQLLIKAPIGKAYGQLHLDIPLKSGPSQMGLLIGLTEGDATQAKNYIPSQGDVLDPALVQWLETAIKAGTVTKGTFLYNGSISETNTPYDSSYDMRYELDQGQLDYDPSWPELKKIKASISVTNSEVNIQGQSADLLANSHISEFHAFLPEVPSDMPAPTLKIHGKVKSDGADGKKILTQTPIDKEIDGLVQNWQVTGDFATELWLKIPFEKNQEPWAKVTVNTDGLNLLIDQADLPIKEISGQVIFDTDKGLSAKNLKGKLFNYPTDFSIDSAIKKQGVRTDIGAKGKFSVTALSQWLNYAPANQFSKGESHYQANLRISPGTDPKLSVSSNLKGVALMLPAPYTKSSQNRAPLSLVATMGHSTLLDFNYNKALYALIRLDSTGLSAGHIRINQGRPSHLPAKGLLVDGFFPTLDAFPWSLLAKKISQTSHSNSALSTTPKAKATPFPIEVKGLGIKHLLYKKKAMLDFANINMKNLDSGLAFYIQSHQLTGSALIPHKEGQPWVIRLKDLYLPKMESIETSKKPIAPKRSPVGAGDPMSLPSLDIRTDNLWFGTNNFGEFTLKTHPIKNGLQAQGSVTYGKDFLAQYNLDWSIKEGLPETHTQINVKGENLGQLLKSWGYTENMDAKKFKGSLDASWNDSPFGFNLTDLNGHSTIKMEKGRFIDVQSSANVLKIFGVFNLTAITRRLTLDFSDIFQKGLTFDTTKAKLQFKNGMLTTEEPIESEGPSANFRMGGCINYKQEKINMKLTVDLPVTQNLPLLALLVGQPEIGGAFYLFDKLTGNQINRVAGINYFVTGDLNDPLVSPKKPENTLECATGIADKKG